MLEQDWYKKIPENLRTVSRMYPWFALWTANFRANPFENSEGRNDRTTFHLDQIDILSWLAIEIKVNNSEEFETMAVSNELLDWQEEVEHELRMTNVLNTIKQIDQILVDEREGIASDIQVLHKVLFKEHLESSASS